MYRMPFRISKTPWSCGDISQQVFLNISGKSQSPCFLRHFLCCLSDNVSEAEAKIPPEDSGGHHLYLYRACAVLTGVNVGFSLPATIPTDHRRTAIPLGHPADRYGDRFFIVKAEPAVYVPWSGLRRSLQVPSQVKRWE